MVPPCQLKRDGRGEFVTINLASVQSSRASIYSSAMPTLNLNLLDPRPVLVDAGVYVRQIKVKNVLYMQPEPAGLPFERPESRFVDVVIPSHLRI